VVYCYELQLDAAMHRKGLGRRLMQMLELLVRRGWGWLGWQQWAAACWLLPTCAGHHCTGWLCVCSAGSCFLLMPAPWAVFSACKGCPHRPRLNLEDDVCLMAYGVMAVLT
jgi:GNAT superfamily N-acetyltransferase